MTRNPRWALGISIALLLAVLVYVELFLNRVEGAVPREPLRSLPQAFEGWRGTDQAFPPKILQNLRVDEYLMRRFAKGNDAIWLYIGYYARQREGAVPHSPRHCYPGNGFQPVRSGLIDIPVTHASVDRIRPNLYVFAKGGERQIVIYWYQSRGRVIANEYTERLYLIRDAILRNRSDGALVRFSIGATAETEEAASRELIRFVSRYYRYIPRAVPD